MNEDKKQERVIVEMTREQARIVERACELGWLDFVLANLNIL